MRLLTVLLLIALATSTCAAQGMWVKGNTHTHTNNSDGDSSAQVVTDWYKSRGYSFLVLSDHYKLTDISDIDLGPTGDFILIPGEEITSGFGGIAVHVNGVGIRQELPSDAGVSLVDTIQKHVDAVNKVGGLAHINHINIEYGFDHRELLQIKGLALMEIFNGFPTANDAGNLARLSTEQIWDVLLSAGMEMYAVATDDAHYFTGDFAKDRSNPGRGWIVVKVNSLTEQEVLDGIRKGNFYASTGVELMDYNVDQSSIRVAVKALEGLRYRIRFVGTYGQILQDTDGVEAVYDFAGIPAGGYVRAKVMASNGTVAWAQPVRRETAHHGQE